MSTQLNQKEFDYLGINKFHEAGYRGQGVTIASKETILKDVFDDVFGLEFETSKDKYTKHGTTVMDFIRQVAPAANKMAINTGGSIKKVNGEKILVSEGMDFLLANPPDVLTTSYFKSNDDEDPKWSCYKELKAKGAYLCLSAGNEDEEIEDLAKEDVWKAIGACNYYSSKNNASRQITYAEGPEMDYMSLHGLKATWDGKKHRGTSFSSPLFAGMIGLVQCFFKEKTGKKLTHEQLDMFVKDHCVDLETKGRDDKSGWGIFILPDPASINIARYTNEPIVEKPAVAAPTQDEIVLTIGSTEAIVNGKEITLDVAPVIMNNRTLVPIRFVSEALGYEVSWDEATQQVKIKTTK